MCDNTCKCTILSGVLLCSTTYLSKRAEPLGGDLDGIFSSHVLHGQRSEGETLVNHVPSMPVQSLQDQMHLLSSISNYHWWASVNKFGIKSAKSDPKYLQHVLFYPEHRNCLPASPRNLLMHFSSYMYSAQMPNADLERKGSPRKMLVDNIMHLVKYDLDERASVLHSAKPSIPPTFAPPPPTNVPIGAQAVNKKRRYASRVISADPEDLLRDNPAGSDGAETLTSSVTQRNLFTLFSEQLHSDSGYIQWRKHLVDEDVVVMNNYDSETGNMQPLEYVHLSVFVTESGEVQTKCTCKTYQCLQGRALRSLNSVNFEDTVLSQNFTCMHCRFYNQFLQPIQASLYATDCINKLHEKVRLTDGEINSPIVLLGKASPGATTKLSVLAGDSLAFVHITFSPIGCMAQCQDGLCSNKFRIRSKIPQGISLRDIPRGNMCEHLHTLLYYNNILHDIFPGFFQRTNQAPDPTDLNIDPAEFPEPEVINMDDYGLRNQAGNISFDVDEGKWKCTSHSHYKPSDNRFDPDLVRCTGERQRWCSELITSGPHHGCYKGPVLQTEAPEGEPVTCPCGEVFSEQCEVLERDVHVYTRAVSILVRIVHMIWLSYDNSTYWWWYINIVHLSLESHYMYYNRTNCTLHAHVLLGCPALYCQRVCLL